MDIHLNKVTVGLLVLALVIGGVIGGALGFVVGSHEGGDRNEMRGRGQEERYKQMNDKTHNHADGEENDDRGGVPNADENMPMQMQATSSLNRVSATTTPTEARP